MPENQNVVGALLGLHAQTSLHAGAGTALGTVDLPIQRERHTGWPMIAGSSLKGVLRDACREQLRTPADKDDGPQVEAGKRRSWRDKVNQDNPSLVAVFGPATLDADKHAGALSVSDARLVAFPVRSLCGVFAWVSCPGVLDRLCRDIALAGGTAFAIPTVEKDTAVLPTASPCIIDGKVVLEEFDFIVRPDAQNKVLAVARWIAERLLPSAPAYQATRERFKSHFVLLPDDDFTHFARHATEVSARIGLDYNTKTVQQGALFYQEFLPPESLLYAVVLANGARGKGQGLDAAAVFRVVAGVLGNISYLQIGADETTGKGLCGVRLRQAREG